MFLTIPVPVLLSPQRPPPIQGMLGGGGTANGAYDGNNARHDATSIYYNEMWHRFKSVTIFIIFMQNIIPAFLCVLLPGKIMNIHVLSEDVLNKKISLLLVIEMVGAEDYFLCRAESPRLWSCLDSSPFFLPDGTTRTAVRYQIPSPLPTHPLLVVDLHAVPPS